MSSSIFGVACSAGDLMCIDKNGEFVKYKDYS